MPYDRFGRWYSSYEGSTFFGQPEMWGLGPANEEDGDEDLTHQVYGPYGAPTGPRPYQRGERLGQRQWTGAPRPAVSHPSSRAPELHQYHYPYYGFGYGGYGQFGGGYGSQADHVVYASTGPYVGVPPKGYVRNDERILEDVNENLTRDAWLDPSDIEVTVENGVVILAGTVDSRLARRRADEDAWHVSGVRDVHNNLRLKAEHAARERTT